MDNLTNCLHCGYSAEFAEDAAGHIAARCTNTACGVSTPSLPAHLEYAAKQRVAAVWNSIALAKDLWPEWRQPTGATDAYAKDARAAHAGKHWMSLVDVNVWEPGVANWREVT